MLLRQPPRGAQGKATSDPRQAVLSIAATSARGPSGLKHNSRPFSVESELPADKHNPSLLISECHATLASDSSLFSPTSFCLSSLLLSTYTHRSRSARGRFLFAGCSDQKEEKRVTPPETSYPTRVRIHIERQRESLLFTRA